jgi:hypothetical protein
LERPYWDKAALYYDGAEVDVAAATRHIYFVLNWLASQDLLTDSGKIWLNTRDDLEVGLFREDVVEEAAAFLDQYYGEWFDDRGIINFQIDTDLELDGDEGLGEYWKRFRFVEHSIPPKPEDKEIANIDLLADTTGQLLLDLALRLGKDHFTFEKPEIQWIEDLARSFMKSGKKKFNKIKVEDSGLLTEQIGTYACEAIRHHVGGRWEICSVKKDPAYGRPVLLVKGGASGDFPRIERIEIVEVLCRMPSGAWVKGIDHIKNPKTVF